MVDEKHLSFYSHWVLRFLRSGFDAEKLSEKDLLQCFSDQLARDDSVEDWQLRQAMKAVELYLNVFLREQENGQRSEGQKSKVGGERPEAGRRRTEVSRLRQRLRRARGGRRERLWQAEARRMR